MVSNESAEIVRMLTVEVNHLLPEHLRDETNPAAAYTRMPPETLPARRPPHRSRHTSLHDPRPLRRSLFFSLAM